MIEFNKKVILTIVKINIITIKIHTIFNKILKLMYYLHILLINY